MSLDPLYERMQREAVLNGWLQIASPFVAEIMARQGFDSVTVDLQHGLMGYDTAIAMLQAISITDAAPIVRVPWNEPGIIMRMADAGAAAIICPMVNTRAQAEAFVGACRYPPAGYRSFGPVRARVAWGDDYASEANRTLTTFAMIETAEAMRNLDEILATPGLNAIYVGPADLSQSLGFPVQVDYEEPELVAALKTILEAADRHGIVAGLHTGSARYACHAVEMGFRFVTVQTDASYLEEGARQVIRHWRGSAAERSASPY